MKSILDLHVHTTEGSPDSSLTPDELVLECRRIDLTGVAVTEHNVWSRHAFAAFAEGQTRVFIRALELYTPLGHVLAFGLEEHVVGFGGDIDAVRRLRAEADRVGAFLVLAHPFRFLFDLPGYYKQNILFRDHAGPLVAEEVATHPVFELVHDIEVVNGGNVEAETALPRRSRESWAGRAPEAATPIQPMASAKGPRCFVGTSGVNATSWMRFMPASTAPSRASTSARRSSTEVLMHTRVLIAYHPAPTSRHHG